ncbi:MAG: hypothetical protein H7A25_10625 [Leptospiraceae bacterium]|nr:hypothetical protein [Leptospiraceae bacterium]
MAADDEYIIIPNPIYDVVFRYLMEDEESAKIILSTLINEKIISIKPEPQSKTEKKESSAIPLKDPKTSDDIRLFHLDFSAKIELPNGKEELVMIELQKASKPNEIFRFKRYISKNFQKKQTQEIVDPGTQAIKEIESPIRLVPIFILNFRIENEINDLLIRTKHDKVGVFKNKNLQRHNEFIDNLIYDIWVVQVPNLQSIKEEDYANDEYKKRLYTLLRIFDQASREDKNEHRLRLTRKVFPDYFDRVIQRLQAAASENPDMEEQMYAEDEYIKALIDRDNSIAFLTGIVEEKEKALEENKKALEEKDKALEEKNRLIQELAGTLLSAGLPIVEVSKKTGLSTEELERL